MTWMDADNNKEMSSIMETEHSNLSGQQSPLDINCEDAISYIQSHLQTHNISTNINFSELTSVSNFAFLERVAEMMLSPELTDCIAIAFFPLVPDLVGRWTKLGEDHREKIACALGRLIHVEPKLNRHMQELLLQGPSFLRTIDHLTLETPSESLSTQLSALNVNDLREALLAAWRLVIFSPPLFRPFLPPPPLLALLQHSDLSIRYLAIELLAISLGIADATKAKYVDDYLGGPENVITAPWEARTIDWGVMPIFDSERLYNISTAINGRNYFTPCSGRKLTAADLGPNSAEICGVLIPRFNPENPNLQSALVSTENTQVNLRAMATGIVAEKPLLLHSVPGAGKSFLIDEIAKIFGRYDDIVRITLTDQTDGKLLLGTYVTTTPGSFAWRPGILTTAVKEGKWIVIEDIERAGNDVLSTLMPLLEGRPLELNGRGDIRMGKGGQIIATTTLFSGAKSAQVENMLGIERWSRIPVIPPTDQDLLQIISNLLPRIQFIAPTLLQVYTSLREIYNHPGLKSSRNLSPRDLLKWTKRTAALCFNIQGESIPREIWDDIFLEAIDCFAAMIPTSTTRRTIIERIGGQMGFPSERIQLYIESHSPNLIEDSHCLRVGRMTVTKKSGSARRNPKPFAYTSHAKKLLEQLAVGVTHREPLLLVGETGTGKTTIVQHLADMLHHRLIVVNVSQQTESSDLLGGFKPVDPRTVAVQLKDTFEGLFERTFSLKRNEAFLARIAKCYSAQKWKEYVKLLREAISKAEVRFQGPPIDDGMAKKKRRVEGDLKGQWSTFADNLQSFEIQLSSGKGKSHAFSFVEGSLIKALRRGDWLLLDEINLAAADTLESISGLIREGGSITLPEKGDLEAIKPHPDFRIFACMNPATDVGKRDLPPALRGQLTEIYVGSPDESIADLLLIVKQYIGHLSVGDERAASDVAQLYLKIKAAAEAHDIVDGVGQKPHFSIRTLTRTLMYVADTSAMYGLRRALYEGFCMSFTTMLEQPSREQVIQMISETIYPTVRNLRSVLRSLPKRPNADVVQIGHYWIEKGAEPIQENPHYIVKAGTSVEQNLHNLVRASITRRYPILLQGPTSAGKTSMIEHLAKVTGHKFLRINNHEHTSLDEYLGNYISTPTGEFLFQEGILVQALRQGHWIVLDELNLAPSDVLEALNRLLDDNRELLIPETQEVIIPHPHFMLFATQNPAGLYGGRKVLSRAFRNRFLELEFDDIPEHELEEILCLRCQIPPSYGAKIVEVYKQLTMHRQSTRLFEQRNSFATLRDLFRWAQREAVGYQQLAENGYMLLAERVRKEDEKSVVKQIIEKVMKVRIDEGALYASQHLEDWMLGANIIWTKAMRRLFILVSQALVNNEPVLLVGETGCGKTTVCQVLAERMGKELHIINAHQNTETGDIIGSQRPYRDRLLYQQRLVSELRTFFSDRPETLDMDLDALAEEFGKLDVDQLLQSSVNPESLSANIERIRETFGRQKVLFEWVDGALVQAMKQGQPFLLDEISLADDSVLERLNSVLEPGRSLVLAEKGGEEVNVVANEGFQFFATMNPGGDYGKKELSPALRNRFTEIWVPAVNDYEDLVQIVRGALKSNEDVSGIIVTFAKWFTTHMVSNSATISIRDIIAWVEFVNATYVSLGSKLSLFHGAMMVYVDGIGTVSGTEFLDVRHEKNVCLTYLSEKLQQDLLEEYLSAVDIVKDSRSFGLGRFSIPRGLQIPTASEFSFRAPTTASNAMKVLRAMQLPKSILLEGAPGIGKTTLIAAIADAAGHPLTRINLSDQTDLMDLFGSDVPIEGGGGGEFGWRDAPFLRAMQNGGWVLLDELNLASQSVLEGLNACIDHRGTAYIPELNRSFVRHPGFRIFAAQNPHAQGGGRKGLPKSFINRFSVVHLEPLTLEDMFIIGMHLYPEINPEMARKMIAYVAAIQEKVDLNASFGSLGKPWEFNLRDVMRWMELVKDQHGLSKERSVGDYLDLVITQRLRTAQDREFLRELFDELVGARPEHRSTLALGLETFQAGIAVALRKSVSTCLHQSWNASSVNHSAIMELLTMCVERNWPCLLVGPPGSVKLSVIRNFASTLGVSLREVSMNSDTDATDIIGGYEQEDMHRHMVELAEQVRIYTTTLLLQTQEALEIAAYGRLIFAVMGLQTSPVAPSILSTLKELSEPLSSLSPILLKLVEDLQHLLSIAIESSASRKFRWYNGVLIDALIHGDWVVLDNANLCNPSVLDRLNSLLEPNGSLVLHEFTNADGTPRIVKPNVNFRLFLTMDPKYGELSRAMRNRAVEVFIAEPFETLQYCLNNRLEEYIGMQAAMHVVQEGSIVLRRAAIRDGQQNDILAKQLLEYIPIISLPYWKRWLRACGKVDNARSTENAMSNNIEMLSVASALNDFVSYLNRATYSVGMPASFAISQTLLPELNDYLPTNIVSSDGSESSMSQLTSLYDLCLKLRELSATFAWLQEEAYREKKIESRPLVLALRPLTKRQLSKQPARSALSMLRSLAAAMESWLFSRGYKIVSEQEMQKLIDLLVLCLQMINLLNEADVDPGYYRVFRDIFNEWMKQSDGAGFSTVLASLRPELNALSTDLALSTGLSMQLIWENSRPHLPSTSEHWSTYFGLLSALKEFESKVQFHIGNLDVIVAVKSSFFKSALALLSASQLHAFPVESLSLEKIATMSEADSYFASSPFLDAFRALNSLFQLRSATVNPTPASDKLLIHLTHLSGTSLPVDRLAIPKSSRVISSLHVHFPQSEVLRQVSGVALLLQSVAICNASQNVSNRYTSSAQTLMRNFGKLLMQTTAITSGSGSSALISLIREALTEVLKLHVDSPSIPEFIRQKLAQLQSSLVDNNPDNSVNGVSSSDGLSVYDYPVNSLRRAISAVCRCDNSGSGSLERYSEVAEASVFFSLASLALYVPDAPFDPAASAIVNKRREELRESELNQTYDTRLYVELRLRGANPSSRLQSDLHKLREIRNASELTRRAPVYRPKTSQIPQIHHELFQLLQNTVKSTKLDNLIEKPNQLELKTFIGNLERMAVKLSTEYPYYGDFLSYIVRILDILIFGLRLYAEVEEAKRLAPSEHQLLNSCLSLADITSTKPLQEWQAVLKLGKAGGSLPLYLLQRLCLLSSIDSGINVSSDEARSIFDAYYVRWRVEKERKKLEESSKTSIYRRKDEELELEAAIAEYFPDQDLESDMSTPNQRDTEAETAAQIVSLHRFLSRRSTPSSIPTTAHDVLKAGLKVVEEFSEDLSGQEYLDSAYPAIVLSLVSTQQRAKNVASPDYDFYRMPNFSETRELTLLLSEFQRLTTGYLESWPEHAILADILSVCARIFDLPNSAPLSRLLPYVERLYALSDQWQDIASRDYTLAGPHGRIRDMIVRWRRLELSTWKVLFKVEEQRHLGQGALWWFDLYETIIYNLRSESTIALDHMEKVLVGLNDFISASRLGDFLYRLQLLQSFAAHAEKEGQQYPALAEIAQGCYHVHNLYDLYSQSITKTLEDRRKPLEKELVETVQLASWRDTSVYALNESARRSHRRLFKTVRKYRELLSEPISPILRAGFGNELDFKLATTNTPNAISRPPSDKRDVAIRQSIEYCRDASVWSAKAKLLLDPLKLSSSMQVIFSRVARLDPDLPITPKDLIESMEDLRKQTPTVLTDENENQVTFLKVQKRRLFAQTMKTLREWGVNSKLAQRDTSSDAARMLATPAAGVRPAHCIEGNIDHVFYRIIDLLPRLRASAGEHSPDVADSEFNRALGHIENLVDGLFAERQTLFTFSERVQKLIDSYSGTVSIYSKDRAENNDLVVMPNAMRHIRSLSVELLRLTTVVRTCITVVESHLLLNDESEISDLKASLQKFEAECDAMTRQIISISSNDSIIFIDDLAIVSATERWFSESFCTVSRLSDGNPALTYALRPVLEVLTECKERDAMSHPQQNSTGLDPESFVQSAEQLAILALGAVQEISLLLDNPDYPARFVQLRRFHGELSTKLRLPNIIEKMESTFTASVPLLTTPSGKQMVLAIFNSLDPILSAYFYGVEEVRNYLTRCHEQFSQMVLVLLVAFHTLATKGYCSPQRAEKETGSGKGEGVGLGEGEGETNISNDIKEDEDLEDLAKQKDSESEQQKGEGDQEGVEMEDDFEGALEDAPEEEEGEEGEQGDDEEEEGDEMDEGTGQVDDTDPTAVDEQFWEDQADKPPESGDEKQMQGKKEMDNKEGDLGANNKDRQQSSEEKADGEMEEVQESDDGGMDEEDENGVQNREDDAFMPEAQPLDIAEDLELNLESDEKDGSVFSDEDMDLGNEDGAQEDVEEEEITENALQEEGNVMTEEQETQSMEELEEEGKDENELNTANVDMSEYQGEDVAASEAAGKGGDSAIADEQRQGGQQDPTTEDRPETTVESAAQQQGADGRGNAQLQGQELEKAPGDQQPDEESLKENPLKQLGDVLEQWRRDLGKLQDIENKDAREEGSVRDQNPEYSYVGEEQQFDTQGLGPAAPEQIQPLDMSMALDEEAPQDSSKATEERQKEEAASGTGMEIDSRLQSTSFGATIGDRAQDPDTMELDPAQTAESEHPPPEPSTTQFDTQPSVSVNTTTTDEARQIWQQHDRATHDLSLSLCEQLRLILEPTLATKMRGDFRTGKRLNMRRIIPYIASDFKKDKIWMRRTKPSKRQYQVMIAMDDSKSMSDSKSVQLAFDTLALTAKALSQLEVGQISIVRFGEDVMTVHGFEEPFTSESGGKVVQQFQFDQSMTDVCALTKSSIQLFNEARAQQDIRSTSGTELWQLELIISDGICEDHETIRRLVREAFESKIMMIFVILDALHSERKDSILDIKSYSFIPGNGGQVVKETRYLDSFPFNYFVIVRDVRELPGVLASALRQWFAEVAER